MTSLFPSSSSLIFIGMVLAAIMGFAIQRGATCTVAAVDELMTKRSSNRLLSMLEASIWVLGGLLAANEFHTLGKMPPGYALTGYTLLGAVLLGIGAYINRACVFGAIARIGCGEWSFLMTPVGFFLGCVAFRALFTMAPNPPLMENSILFRYPGWISFAIFAWVLYRVFYPLVSSHIALSHAEVKPRIADHIKHALKQRSWSPGTATIVIGISFLLMFLLLGPWAYTDVLADLSFNMANNLFFRSLLLIALFVGAIGGGWSAGRLRNGSIEFAQVLRCMIGGAMMGIGSLMIPGSNDGLLLIGLPLLWSYAWVAFATMGVSIALCMLIAKK
jgi:hypothetical protein